MSRAVIILVTGFWLTMNVLLWQTEYGSRKGGGTVPANTVWEKILTAADDSSLSIFHRGKLVGACHLRTGAGEEWSNAIDENAPARPPEKGGGYHLRLDGTAVIPEWTNRLRFEGELKLDKNRDWQDLNARVTLHPVTWEIHSAVAEKRMHLKIEGVPDPLDLDLPFSDLQNPATLVYKLFGPAAGELAAEAGLMTAQRNASAIALGVKWDAQEDSIRIGRTPVQVYRLHTRLIDRYDISVMVSRAGEILRVDLPGDSVLMNDRLASTQESNGRKPQTKAQNPSTDRRIPGTND